MPLIEKLKGEEAPKQGKKNPLSEEAEADANLATALGVKFMLEPDMQQNMGKMLSAADPVMAMGQFLSQMIMNIKEQADANGLALDDQIWLARGGVVERLFDQGSMIAESMGIDLPASAEPAVVKEVMNVLKMAAQSGQGGAQQQAPQGPPMMQQGQGGGMMMPPGEQGGM